MRDERKDELDCILDAALQDYSKREPRAGLAQRIVRRVEAAPHGNGSRWWMGWVGIPVSLVLIALVVITAGRDRPKVQAPSEVAHVMQLPALSPVPTVAKVATKPAKLPKPERVPERETLTPGERALLSFARRDPEQARELVADSGQVKELKIDPLKIEELP